MLTRPNAGLVCGLLLCASCPSVLADDWKRPNDPAYQRYPTEPQIAPQPELESRVPIETTNGGGKRVYAVNVRNAGALDARVMLRLFHNEREVTGREARADGLETTEVRFRAAGLPPAGQLAVRMENGQEVEMDLNKLKKGKRTTH